MSTCARCGKAAQGFATIGPLRYCHGDQEQPTCYMQQNWDNLRTSLDEHATESLSLAIEQFPAASETWPSD